MIAPTMTSLDGLGSPSVPDNFLEAPFGIATRTTTTSHSRSSVVEVQGSLGLGSGLNRHSFCRLQSNTRVCWRIAKKVLDLLRQSIAHDEQVMRRHREFVLVLRIHDAVFDFNDFRALLGVFDVPPLPCLASKHRIVFKTFL